MMKFIKFCIVGAVNTLVSLCVYYILIYVGLGYQVSNLIGFIVGVSNSYYFNSKWVFKSKDSKSAITKFFIVNILTWILSALLLLLWINTFAISDKIAPLINLFITVPLNYILIKQWAFKKNI